MIEGDGKSVNDPSANNKLISQNTDRHSNCLSQSDQVQPAKVHRRIGDATIRHLQWNLAIWDAGFRFDPAIGSDKVAFESGV